MIQEGIRGRYRDTMINYEECIISFFSIKNDNAVLGHGDFSILGMGNYKNTDLKLA